MITATEARLKFDFDRASSVVAALACCFGDKKANPIDFNPYRKRATGQRYTVDEIERSHAAHVKGGRHIVQTISASQVVN